MTTIAHSSRADSSRPQSGQALAFSIRLIRALHAYGIPTHRLENVMQRVSAQLGLDAQYFVSPSAIFIATGTGDQQRTIALKPSGGDVDLEKLDAVDSLTKRVAQGEISPDDAILALDAIEQRPDRYSAWLSTLCFGITSAAAARLFGGGWREILVAACIGLLVGGLILLAGRSEVIGRILPALAAFLAMALAKSAGLLIGDYAFQTAVLTGLIVLIPGLSLTIAMTELAAGHPVSGTTRLANACVLFMMIGFGVALGGQVDRVFEHAVPLAEPIALPAWTEHIAYAFVAFGFVVLFKARPRDYLWVLSACLVSLWSTQAGRYVLGPELGVFIAAFALATYSNLFSRLMDRPAAITIVPGIMLLVPGAIGFRSMSSLLEHDALTGIASAFSMVLVGIALVAGLIIGHAMLPAKRQL